MSHVELGVCEVVGVLTHPFDVIASLLAGPAAVTVAVLVPEVRPVAAAVRMQEPGTPVMLRVEVVFVPLTAIVPEVGETLQTLALSTDHVTVVLAVAVVVMPFASFRVAVAVVDVAVPAGNADWPRVTLSEVGAPGPVKATFAVQPVMRPAAADSWSVPVVALEVGAASENVTTPLEVVLVLEAPTAPPSRLLVTPAWDRVTLVPLFEVTVLPSESWTVTVIVEVAVVEPAASEVGFAAQASFAGAPTFGT